MTRKQKVQISAGILLALGLMALALRGIEWSKFLESLQQAKLGYLLGLVCATFVYYLARAWRWGFLYRPLAPIPMRDLLSATYVGFLSALVVPRAGEVLRPYLISRRHPVSTSAGFATIILERLIDLITVLLLFVAYLYILPMPEAQQRGPVLDKMKWAGVVMGLVAFSGLAVLIAFHAYSQKAFAVADRLLGLFPEKLARPFNMVLRSFHEGLAVLEAPAPLLLAIAGQSLLVWIAVGSSFYFNNLAFGIVLPFHSVFLLLAALTVGVAIPTPGSVGGFHAFYMLAMEGAFGVAHETAAAASITAHALSNIPVLVIGLLCLGREGLTMGKVAELASEETK